MHLNQAINMGRPYTSGKFIFGQCHQNFVVMLQSLIGFGVRFWVMIGGFERDLSFFFRGNSGDLDLEWTIKNANFTKFDLLYRNNETINLNSFPFLFENKTRKFKNRANLHGPPY